MDQDPMEMALSTDVVMDIILSHLKAQDLLSCRLASKFWNQTASSVLRKRSTRIKIISKIKNLTELGECMRQSSDFPFVGLQFPQPWKLGSAGALEFFKNYGSRFTRLCLDSRWTIRLQDLAPFIKHLPRLSILEVGPPRSRPPHVELSDPVAGQEDGKLLKLPSVRTIRISRNAEVNEDILREVIEAAASPSLRIECHGSSYGICRALKSAGKLQAVSVMSVHKPEDVEDCIIINLLSSELPALTKLNFLDSGWISRKGLMKLLISSQHTLKELSLHRIHPSEFLSECPVLPKLTTLILCIYDQSYEFVFQGGQGHKFPALKELKLDTTFCRFDPSVANLSDDLFIVPSLTTIDLIGVVGKAGIEDLARSFPNVIDIWLEHDTFIGVSGNTYDIWSVGAFKFLEKLRIWHYTVQPTSSKNYMNMDRFLTGIPMTICDNLRRHPQQNLMDSPFNEILRDSPNILQLQNLKQLVICLVLKDVLTEIPEEPPFMSMVSVWYALQMIPNLEAKFVYDYRLPPWPEEERDKAVTVLKGALKHVQPYIELEDFYY